MHPVPYNPDGSLNWGYNNNQGFSTFNNPYAALNNTLQQKTNTLVTNVLFSYEIVPGLSVKSNFGYTNLQQNESLLAPSTAIEPEFKPYYLPSASYTYNNSNSWIIEPQLTYNKTIGKGKNKYFIGKHLR